MPQAATDAEAAGYPTVLGKEPQENGAAEQTLRLFLWGDVMIGRGIDQILPHPCDPALHEGYTRSAIDYVRLAEAAHGPIPRNVPPAYIWGAALDELEQMRPDARVVNLETSITYSETYLPKGINYRVSPPNARCLAAAGIDCCTLANNHVLDWGRRGLLDTLAALKELGISHAGAGHDAAEASAPAVLEAGSKGRVLVYSFASATSGTPRDWAAGPQTAGVNLLPNLSEATANSVCAQIAAARRPRDVVVASVHWGSNWGYEIAESQRRFAHTLVETAGVSVVHGHSSHHAKALEVYHGGLILYGCGDFLNDYEGISGYEQYRDDLPLMYFADFDPGSGGLVSLEIVPLQIRNFRLVPPDAHDASWLARTLARQSERFGVRVDLGPDRRFAISWPGATARPT